jgi:1,3-beta-glucanosyltransferase GAS3
VGYSAADVRDILVDTWNYLQCTTTGDDTDVSRVDLFALNSYSWCGDSSFTTSSYNVLISDLADTSVPVFFSEYGCNTPAPRVFTEVPVIYGPQMTPVLSGGMVYEYSQEASDFGLVNLDSNGSAQLLPDYYTLQKQFGTLNVTYLQDLPALNTSVTAPKCSASLISSKTFNNNFTLPAVPPGAQALIDNGISPAPVGKLVTVTGTAVSQTVQADDGTVIQGLAIIPLSNDESNTPGSIPNTTSSAAPAATSKKSAAVHAQRNWTGLAIAGLLAAGWISLM